MSWSIKSVYYYKAKNCERKWETGSCLPDKGICSVQMIKKAYFLQIRKNFSEMCNTSVKNDMKRAKKR